MKFSFIIIFFLLLSTIVKSQEPAEGIFPLKDSAIYYERIITLDSTTKENIYKAVKSWGVNAFKSQKDVLQADDKEIGLIAYRYWFAETYNIEVNGTKASAEWKYYVVMKIFIKDEKAKIVVQNVELKISEMACPIITLMADSERIAKELEASDKTYTKYLKKINTPELKQKQFAETKRNFEKANRSILTMIESVGVYIESSKSEFDF